MKSLRIAAKHKLKVIEDCAHAHGGMWNGKGAGSMGDLGAFSFQSSKLITSGEGGIVITNNLEYMERVQSYINAGRASLTDQFHHRIVGFNYRLGEFQAAVLGPQLDRLPEQAATREKNMKHFETRLKGIPAIGLLKPEPRITRLAPYGYVIKYFSEKAKDIPRANFVAALQLEGVPCDGLFYEPVYKSSLFPLDPDDFPALSWGHKTPLDLRNMYSCPEADRAAYRKLSGSCINCSSVRPATLTPSPMPYKRCSGILTNSVALITKPSATRNSAGPTAKADRSLPRHREYRRTGLHAGRKKNRIRRRGTRQYCPKLRLAGFQTLQACQTDCRNRSR